MLAAQRGAGQVLCQCRSISICSVWNWRLQWRSLETRHVVFQHLGLVLQASQLLMVWKNRRVCAQSVILVMYMYVSISTLATVCEQQTALQALCTAALSFIGVKTQGNICCSMKCCWCVCCFRCKFTLKTFGHALQGDDLPGYSDCSDPTVLCALDFQKGSRALWTVDGCTPYC